MSIQYHNIKELAEAVIKATNLSNTDELGFPITNDNPAIYKAINDLPTKVLLEPFDSLTGFIFATNSTQTLLTSGQTQGTGAIQMNGNTINATLTASKSVSVSIDPTTLGTIVFEVSKDITNIASVTGYALSLSRGTTETSSSVSDSPTKFRAGKRWLAWNIDEFPITKAAGVGALTATARTNQASPYTAQVTYDAMYYNAKGRPTVVPTFDDIYDTIYTTVFPLFKTWGIVGSISVPIDYIGTTGKLTLNQLNELYASGWDIFCDSTRDDSVTDLANTTNALLSINANRDFYTVQGWDRAKNYLCWTNGSWNEATCAAFAGAGYLTGRTTEPQSFYDRFGLGSIALTLPSHGFSSSQPLSSSIARITEVLLRGTTQFFHWHDIKDTPSSIGWQTSNFITLWEEYILPKQASGELDILTVSQHGRRTLKAT